MNNVNCDNIELALRFLESGELFEKFSNSFLSGFLGESFIPVGGVKDGGLDGYDNDPLLENREGLKKIFQISKTEEKGTKEKIKNTIKRIGESRKDAEYKLYYFSSQLIKDKDKIEEEIHDELKVFVKIWDRRYIVSNINHNNHTKSSYEIIKHIIEKLAHPGNTEYIPQNSKISNASVLVFLRQELDEDLDSDVNLVDTIADCLILWALEGTDPDKGIFLKREEIKNRILGTFPQAKNWAHEKLNSRLTALSSKSYPDGRQVNHHTKEDQFCLPHDTREKIKQENVEDVIISERFYDSVKERVVSSTEEKLSNNLQKKLTSSIVLALQNTFEKEGLAFCEFLDSGDVSSNYESVSKQLEDAFGEKSIVHNKQKLIELCEKVIRELFYNSTELEKEYLGKLAKTYSLLFSLRLDYSLWNYFDDMQSSLRLLVGTDMIVRAFSEKFVASERQGTRNLFKILKDAGATLILTSSVLEKVHSHLITSDNEFSTFKGIEDKVTEDIWRNSPKILVRAYFHTKKDVNLPTKPHSWASFINQFCDYPQLRSSNGKEQLKRYIVNEFGMQFFSNDEMSELLSEVKDFDDQVENLLDIKENRELAIASVKIINCVYKLRERDKEHNTHGTIGYKTWCLSSERRILSKTKDLKKRYGAEFLMRPEFLLNYILLAPSQRDIRTTFRKIMPSLLGLKLSNRVSPTAYQELMKQIVEAKNYDDGRLEAKISEVSDKLKSDYNKDYDIDVLNDFI